MARPGWYVVQVETGRERTACEAIARACGSTDDEDAPLVAEVFSPRYRTRFKLRGEWRDEERTLLPGYVVVVTTNPWVLAHELRVVPGFMRVVTSGETFAPLGEEDRAWVERWTTEGDRTIPMSFARKVGERVVVEKGPLKGREATIVRVKRRLCEAEVEIHVGQITIRTTVGLAVLPEGFEG